MEELREPAGGGGGGGGGDARANLEVKVENQSTIAQVYGLVLSIQFVETCQANKWKFNSCIMTKSWLVEG
jgi:hypothetical protein